MAGPIQQSRQRTVVKPHLFVISGVSGTGKTTTLVHLERSLSGDLFCLADVDEAGVPYCQGGIMARNAEWRKSVDEWEKTVDGWVSKSSQEDLLKVDIFFDAVGVYGERSLADKIWLHAYERAHHAPAFQNLLIWRGAGVRRYRT